jgi:chromosomal replication initiator protein
MVMAELITGGDGTVTAQWQRVRARLREEFGEAAYRSWLCSLTLAEVVEGAVRIEVPTRFLRDWVLAHYVDRIRALWIGENRAISKVEVTVAQQRVMASANGAAPELEMYVTPAPEPAEAMRLSVPPVQAIPAAAAAEGDSDREVSAPLDVRFTFENFVVGKPNELAHAAARRVAEAAVSGNRAAPFNPLFLYGGVGLGKTHLMHAIAWHIRRHDPSRRIIYLSAEKFMYQFIKALRFKDTMAFKEQFRSVDVLMIDDVQFISGKDSTQEEFFHTFNALVDQNRQIVISADKSPSDLEGMEERMRSRLGWGLVADIHPTTYELRLGILQAKAEHHRQASIPPKVLEFLAHKITSNVRELEGALTRITAHAHLVGRAITLESAQDVLHDLLRANDRRVTIDEIQKRVAEHFNIRLADMHSARRARAVARPRQVAMYLCKQLTPRSLPEIGRKFGGRDHTTVMHAVKKVEELLAADRALAEDIELLRRMLEI